MKLKDGDVLICIKPDSLAFYTISGGIKEFVLIPGKKYKVIKHGDSLYLDLDNNGYSLGLDNEYWIKSRFILDIQPKTEEEYYSWLSRRLKHDTI